MLPLWVSENFKKQSTKIYKCYLLQWWNVIFFNALTLSYFTVKHFGILPKSCKTERRSVLKFFFVRGGIKDKQNQMLHKLIQFAHPLLMFLKQVMEERTASHLSSVCNWMEPQTFLSAKRKCTDMCSWTPSKKNFHFLTPLWNWQGLRYLWKVEQFS